MFNCKESSELVSKKRDYKLSFYEKFSLKMHLLMCKACSLFEVESDLISDSLKKGMQNIPTLNEKKKEAIQKLLNEKS